MQEKLLTTGPQKRRRSQANRDRSTLSEKMPDWPLDSLSELGGAGGPQPKRKTFFDAQSDLSVVAFYFLELRRRSRLKL